ncbi:MAG: hypothetical protein ACYCV6_02885 [Steroidobacteraceae bacterium]|jgi:hypothetical protein
MRLSKKALENLAREIRRASWGTALAFAGAGFKSDIGLGYLLGSVLWVALQVAALLIESYAEEE